MRQEPKIEQRDAQAYLAIAREVTDGVPAAVDSAFPELFGWLREHGVAPAGAPFIRFVELDAAGEPLALEVAVPDAGDAPGGGPVHAAELPAGRYVTAVHVGPYRSETEADLADSRAELLGWIAARDLVVSYPTPRGTALPCSVERYRVGPPGEPDPRRWETEFAFLIG